MKNIFLITLVGLVLFTQTLKSEKYDLDKTKVKLVSTTSEFPLQEYLIVYGESSVYFVPTHGVDHRGTIEFRLNQEITVKSDLLTINASYHYLFERIL